jgi:hypothetical protein
METCEGEDKTEIAILSHDPFRVTQEIQHISDGMMEKLQGLRGKSKVLYSGLLTSKQYCFLLSLLLVFQFAMCHPVFC